MHKFAFSFSRSLALALILTPYMVPAAYSQAIFESGGTNAMAAGLGAGAAASAGKGKFLQGAYRSAAEAQQAAIAEATAIKGYMKQGCEFEAKKEWAEAEKCFRYCLQISSMYDGPGSPKMIPTLQHLVTAKVGQNELNDAIGFQQRIVSFAKLDKIPDPARIIGAQIELSNLLMQKQDYENAEEPLRDSYNLARSSPGLPVSKRRVLCQTYAKVLHGVGKEEEAASVEAAGAALMDVPEPQVTAKIDGAGQTRPTQNPVWPQDLNLARGPKAAHPQLPAANSSAAHSDSASPASAPISAESR